MIRVFCFSIDVSPMLCPLHFVLRSNLGDSCKNPGYPLFRPGKLLMINIHGQVAIVISTGSLQALMGLLIQAIKQVADDRYP
jgi:hypothetical protein